MNRIGKIRRMNLVLRLMNSELREREADTFLVEGGVDNAVHIEHDIPVVSSLGPYTYLDVSDAGGP